MRPTALFIVLIAYLLAASCRKDVELAGHLWTTTYIINGSDGERCKVDINLLCNSENSGVLFISETYDSDPMPYGSALPFSYTWDGDDGSVSIASGASCINLPIEYEKAEHYSLNLDLSGLRDYYPYLAMEFALGKKEYYAPVTVDGSHWEFGFGEPSESYLYVLDFSADSAALNLTYTAGDEEQHAGWGISYTFANGVGDMRITNNAGYFGSFHGYFYLPDDGHLMFYDSENVLPMSR